MELDISFLDWRQRIPYSWHGKRKRWTQDILETTGFFGNVQAPLKFSKVRRSAWYVILAGRLLSRFSNEVKDRSQPDYHTLNPRVPKSVTCYRKTIRVAQVFIIQLKCPKIDQCLCRDPEINNINSQEVNRGPRVNSNYR